ncbi:hypothetical protein [uncultured Stenotrophomonas sp.]|uniref:hypothetical protein n=1 Tax=uncultured Stenotrophomonas sp. TaxID=165438 RepID=UPI001311BEDD|nr:hypothetical protein [uncultured Stenotrophomonas sp.]
MQVDTFGLFVRAELDHWGREFALHRDCDYLGHHSKNLLSVLIEHKGDMPAKTQGYKPLESDSRAQRIEDLVAEIARTNAGMACVLRAYYCGIGRKKVERYETCLLLLTNLGEPPVTVRGYLEMVRRGEDRIYGMLSVLSRAA